jgi:hypothetical protein
VAGVVVVRVRDVICVLFISFVLEGGVWCCFRDLKAHAL